MLVKFGWWNWRPWEQGRAIDNARAASVELSRARVEREAVDLYLARLEKLQLKTRSA